MRQVGIFQVLLSGFCFGFLGIFGKRAYELGLTPGEFLALRFVLASIILAIYLAARNPSLFRIAPAALGKCALLGILGYAIFSSCFFYALNGLSASLTVLLLYTYPVIVSLSAWALFAEKPAKFELLALPLVMLGLALLVWGDMRVNSALSLLFGFSAAVFYSLYILASSHWLKGIHPLSTTLYIMSSAAIALSAMHIRPARFPLPGEAWLVVGATALISTVMAMSLFLAGLQKLKNSEVSLLSTAEPITGVALATVFWGEMLSAAQWLGGAFVIGGMLLVARASKAPDTAPPA
jgi:drug/metabolite transporter (DMT)-like permease